MPRGRVLEIRRWPVKSMAGETLSATLLDERGAGGDRSYAVVYERKGQWKPLTGREVPRILAWRAGYPTAPDSSLVPAEPPLAQVTGPDGRTWLWDDPELASAIADDLGRPVRLECSPEGFRDENRTVLVTTEATRLALADELEKEVELDRFRPNFHLELDLPAWAEHELEGSTLRFSGGVAMRLLEPCDRCAIPTRDPRTQAKWPALLRKLASEHDLFFGIRARVLEPGLIRASEAVEVVS